MKLKPGLPAGFKRHPVDRRAYAAMQAIIAKQEAPVLEAQLKTIWPLWNALPAELPPEERRKILTFDPARTAHPNPKRAAHFRKLRRRFLNAALPLSSHEYSEALQIAELWSSRVAFARTTRQRYSELVRVQWTFAHADFHAFEEIAIFRTAKEFEETKTPGFLDCAEPKLWQIELLEECYQAYLDAHTKAFNELAKRIYKVIYKVLGTRQGKPLPLEEVALGWPHPPDDVPRHLFIARLNALGICSPARLTNFTRDEYPKLDESRRREYDRVAAKPRYGKDPFAALLVWALDNAPVLKRFDWQGPDLLKAASERGIHRPSNRTSFKQLTYRHGLGLYPLRGRRPLDEFNIHRSTPLLSPPPVFGDVPKRGFRSRPGS